MQLFSPSYLQGLLLVFIYSYILLSVSVHCSHCCICQLFY